MSLSAFQPLHTSFAASSDSNAGFDSTGGEAEAVL